MTGPRDLSRDELTEVYDTAPVEATRRLVVAVGGLRDAVVSQQRTTNRMTEVLVGLTVVILGLTVAQVVFFVLR